MAWIYLVLAGVFEIGFTTALRFVNFLKPDLPALIFVVCAAASFALLQFSLKGIPLGTAYAVWTGIGAAGTALVGIWFYEEPATMLRLLFLAILIGSIMGLKLVSDQ
jgi:quaternary ammonium compound-resistance protein SugE